MSSDAVREVALVGSNGLPLRLFIHSGYPVTDVDGKILQNIAGEKLARIEPSSNTYKDLRNRDLTDAHGRTPNQWGFDPTQQLEKQSGYDVLKDVGKQLFDVKGRPLTDEKCRPLLNRDGLVMLSFGPRGEPYSDLEGKTITNEMGLPVETNTVKLVRNGRPLFIFNEQGQPLTDSNGFVLLDTCGRMLVVLDTNLSPVQTTKGGFIFDSKGLKSSDAEFDPTSVPTRCTFPTMLTVSVGNECGLAFNSYGQPLTNLQGQPLISSFGIPLITERDNTWLADDGCPVTIVKKTVYDRVSCTGFTNPEADPVLLFNIKGWPLTDFKGTPQYHASGKLLVRLNSEMCPVGDMLGNEIYDITGCTFECENLKPSARIKISEHLLKQVQTDCGRLFNKCGYPLTNTDGFLLLNPELKLLVLLNDKGKPFRDIEGGCIFDASGLPVWVDFDSGGLFGPNHLPLRLYNSSGIPVTDSKGRVLGNISGKPYLSVDQCGILISSIKGETIHDKNKNSRRSTSFDGTIASDRRSDKLIMTNGKPLCLYDHSGHPLTDLDGNILHDDSGRPLVKCHPSETITTRIGEAAFDINGYRCYRSVSSEISKPILYFDNGGHPLTDQFGDVLLTRKGQKLIKYKRGKPKFSVDGSKLNADSQLRESYIVYHNLQLYDVNDIPLTDAIGDLLYTLSGIPLLSINSFGKIESDFLGRPVFDQNGLPASKCSGCWKDRKGRPLKLFNIEGYPLTDEEGAPLMNIDDKKLVLDDESGRPLYDLDYRPVRDSRGRCVLSIDFNPILKDRKMLKLLETDTSGLRVFNANGWPLTSRSGRVLVNSENKKMLNVKNGLDKMTTLDGKPVFDAHRRPFGCNPLHQMYGIDSKPYLLFRSDGTLLTSDDGKPLMLDGGICAITFDTYGRPFGSIKGGGLVDGHGRCLPSTLR